MSFNGLKPLVFYPHPYHYSSLFLLKSSYQRNMIIGLLTATILVVFPFLLFAYWSSPVKATISDHRLPVDSVIVNLPFGTDMTVLPPPPVTPAGLKKIPKLALNGTAEFSNNFELINDDDFVDSTQKIIGGSVADDFNYDYGGGGSGANSVNGGNYYFEIPLPIR